MTDEQRERNRASKRAWKKANPEKVRATNRALRKANPERYRAYSRTWIEASPANHEKQLEAQRAWAKANPEKRRASAHKRRARKLGSAEWFDAAQFAIIKAFYGYQCVKCHRSESQLAILGLLLVPDHVIALAKGGSNDISNIQPLCHGTGGCNNGKSTKHEDYRPRIE